MPERACPIFGVATGIRHTEVRPGENWARPGQQEIRKALRAGIRAQERRGGGFVTRRVTNPLPPFFPQKNSAHFCKTRRAIASKFLFPIFPPEKVGQQVLLAEMKNIAPHPDGSRAPRAPPVSRETQGTLSPLSFDRQNETRVPLEPSGCILRHSLS